MIGKFTITVGILLLVLAQTACGTMEVSLADEDSQSGEITPTQESTEVATKVVSTAMSTESTVVEPSATPPAPEASATVTSVPDAAGQVAPAGWQRFYAEDYGVELWHPPGTTVVVDEPSSPEFSSVEIPEPIIEEQVFTARVMQEEGGPLGPPGSQAILQVKLVANAEGKSVGEMAELFSKRCPGALNGTLQPTTVNVQLSGYRYGCEGIDGIIFNEFWSPHPFDPQLLFGASWAEMSAPLSDEILATLTFAG